MSSSTLKWLKLTLKTTKSGVETFNLWDLKQRGLTSSLFDHDIILRLKKPSEDLTLSVRWLGQEVSSSPFQLKLSNRGPSSLETIFSNLDNELKTQVFGALIIVPENKSI